MSPVTVSTSRWSLIPAQRSWRAGIALPPDTRNRLGTVVGRARTGKSHLTREGAAWLNAHGVPAVGCSLGYIFRMLALLLVDNCLANLPDDQLIHQALKLAASQRAGLSVQGWPQLGGRDILKTELERPEVVGIVAKLGDTREGYEYSLRLVVQLMTQLPQHVFLVDGRGLSELRASHHWHLTVSDEEAARRGKCSPDDIRRRNESDQNALYGGLPPDPPDAIDTTNMSTNALFWTYLPEIVETWDLEGLAEQAEQHMRYSTCSSCTPGA